MNGTVRGAGTGVTGAGSVGEAPATRPLLVTNLDDPLGLDPRVLVAAGERPRARGTVAPRRLERLAQLVELAGIEARSHPAGVDEPVRLVDGEVQRPNPGA